MATEFVTEMRPLDFIREVSGAGDPNVVLALTGPGKLRGLPLPKYRTANNKLYGYTGVFRLPANWTYTTGLTFKVFLTDDGVNALDPGKKVYIGITVKRLAQDETTDIDVAGAAEVLTSITLSTTQNGVTIGTVSIANAGLDSAAAGDLVAIRIRRKGDDATNDTCGGRVLMLALEAQNT